MYTSSTNQPFLTNLRRLSVFLLFTFGLWHSVPAEENAPWVKLFHPDPASLQSSLQRAGHRLELHEKILWGQMSPGDILALERQGIDIVVKSRPFDVTLGEQRFDPVSIDWPDTTEQLEDGWYLLQFTGPVRNDDLIELQRQGIQFAQPLYPFSFFVWASADQLTSVRSAANVRQILPMNPDWKLLPSQRGFGRDILPTMALASRHADQPVLEAALNELGQVQSISRFNAHFVIVQIDLPGDRYADLARVPAIYTVQYIPPETATRGEMSNQSVVGNINANGNVVPGYQNWLDGIGFDGSGITVGVVDSGILTTHQDLIGQMSPCVSGGVTPSSCTSSPSTHGTHVAGAVAGTGASGITNAAGFLRGQGVAPGARIVEQRYNPLIGAGPGGMVPDGMLTIFRESSLSGALLTNNSWGPSGTPQGYNIPTQQIDFISRDANPSLPGQQPIIAIWSIMNGNGDSAGACAPSSLGAPDEAKNLFAVGSTSLQSNTGAQLANVFNISSNSAHGPACDGRLVPHIVAPGCNTDGPTAGSTSAFGLLCGTSMASPVVTGAVAVWAEKYLAETGQPPSPALVKAVFTAGAQNLVGNSNADGGSLGHRPDRFQGFGRLDLASVMDDSLAVFTLDQTTTLTQNGEEWQADFTAEDPDQPIRIMLAWTDAPGHGLGGTTPAWVNDLDLIVSAGGQQYFGNVIDGDGWSASGGGPDHRNNLEGVFLNPDQHDGSVQLRVRATSLGGDAIDPWNPAASRQDFAIVCINCREANGFLLSSPTDTIPVCLNQPVDFPLTVSAINNFSDPVELSASDLPAGVSALFAPPNLVPEEQGSNVSVALIGTSTLPAGPYPFVINANSFGPGSPPIQVSESLALLVSDSLPGPSTLLAPGEGATVQAVRPTLQWSAVNGVWSYTVEVAETADFSNLLYSNSVTVPSHTVSTSLPTDQTLFWRVRNENSCGSASFSAVGTFSISGPVCRSPNLPIPDADAAGITDTLTLVGPDTIGDLQVYLQASHTWVGDLIFTLTSPSGTEVRLIDRPGVGSLGTFGCDNDDIAVTLDDGAQGSAQAACSPTPPAIGGTLRPAEPLAAFVGEPISGEWGLNVADLVSPDPGVLETWCLTVSEALFPSITLDPGALSANVGAGLEQEASLQIINSGTAGLDWSFHEDANCSLPDDIGWLSVTQTNGSVPMGSQQILNMRFNASALSTGVVSDTLCILSNDPNNTVLPLPITLTVVETFTVGGTVSGLTGTGLMLQNNGGSNLAVNANGPFVFTTGVADGSDYQVTVKSQPAGQICSVIDGSGTINGAAVDSVNINCIDAANEKALQVASANLGVIFNGGPRNSATPVRIDFPRAFSEPPVVIVMPGNEGLDPRSVRVRNVTATGFELLPVTAPPHGGSGP
ncbi:MAG: S8 family serine peptidase, partial [Wenzhouxiangella sp.]